MENNFGKRLVQIMKEKKIKQTELSEMTGISVPTLGRWKKGIYSPSIDDIENLAFVLGVPAPSLLMGGGDGEQPGLKENVSNVGRITPAVRVPVLGRINAVCCGTGFDLSEVEAEIVDYEYIPEEWVLGHIRQPYPIYIVHVEGNSMEPLIMDGERILVNPNETEPPHGGVSLIKWHDRVFVRGVFYEKDGVRLRAGNPAYRDEFVQPDGDDELFFCGMVLCKIPKVVPISGML